MVFGNSQAKQTKETEIERDRLYQKVGKLQVELIGLPRSSYYREGLAGQETPKNLEFMRLIDNEYTDHPFYGTRQIRNVLRRKGHKINRKRVQRLMQKNWNSIHCTEAEYQQGSSPK